MECLWESLVQSAEEVIGEKPKISRNHFDEECSEVIRQKDATRQRLLNSGTRRRTEEYREARRITKTVFRRKEIFL